MGQQAASGRHYIVGGGIAALAAAVLLMRDGGVPGDRITILEHRDTAGGSLDGAGDPQSGYLTRGGRMFEPQFVCTLDLLSSIPAPDDPTISVRSRPSRTCAADRPGNQSLKPPSTTINVSRTESR
jgi:oleate hydratase